jgi:hypothetical protein
MVNQIMPSLWADEVSPSAGEYLLTVHDNYSLTTTASRPAHGIRSGKGNEGSVARQLTADRWVDRRGQDVRSVKVIKRMPANAVSAGYTPWLSAAG